MQTQQQETARTSPNVCAQQCWSTLATPLAPQQVLPVTCCRLKVAVLKLSG